MGTIQSSLVVRRAVGASTPSAKRSVKIWRPHRDGVTAEAANSHDELDDTSRER